VDFVLGFDDPDDFPRAREVLIRAGYTEEGLREALGVKGPPPTRAIDVAVWMRRTRAGTPLDTLLRLFIAGVGVDPRAAAHALDPMSPEKWVDAGLLCVREGRVLSRVRLLPFRTLWLASDPPQQIRAGAAPDFVLSVGGASTLLARVAIRERPRRTLDLGTGCGVLALLASRQSESVTATDKNPRALAFARFNAALNGVANAEFLAGDLFEPVAGRRFDRILCNPPFVISPTARYVFRDSGMRGDQFCRQIIRQTPSFLEEGGFSQMICNWPLSAGQSWEEGLAGWFDDIGCDVIVWGNVRQDASEYARTWIQDTEVQRDDEVRDLYERWMDYLERERIESVHLGLVSMRRTNGRPNWVHYDVPHDFVDSTVDACARSFELQDFLQSARSDQRLLEERFRVSPEARLEQRCKPAEDAWSAESARLRIQRGPVFESAVDGYLAGFVVRCNGKRSLRELFAELAGVVDMDLDRITSEGLDLVRRLVQRGFLLPSCVDDTPNA
jgi:hypothetical protein